MTEARPISHRRLGVVPPRWLAAGGAVALAAVVGVSLLLQNGGSACAAPPSTSASKGKATFYDLAGGTGNCSFASTPADGLFVALGPAQYSGSAACGTYLDVTGPKGKVRVKVTDSCPECAPGHLDLSRTAFKRIGAEVDGIIPITYRTVANPSVPGPISVRIKEGASRYWFAVLIDNHGTQLSSVQVAGPGGSFRATHRESYNYWLLDSGAGPGPFRLKVTDVSGRSRTLSGITLSPGKVQRPGSSGTTVKAPPAASASATPAKKNPTTKPSPTAPRASAASPPTAVVPPASVLPPADVPAAGPTTTPAAVDLAANPSSCG